MERKEINAKTGNAVSVTVIPHKDANNNLLILDEGVIPPEGFLAISDVEAAALVPQFVPKNVTMRQARLALLQANKLQAVNNAIAAMTGAAGDSAQIEWNYSNEVKRNQPLTLSLAQAIGMTEDEMDQLFITAATL